MWLPVIGLLLGFIIGYIFKVPLSADYAKYMSVALLASVDSIFGGIRSVIENKYNGTILITGFIFNSLLAGSLAYIGDRVGVDLYYAAIFAFGVRIFQNLGIIRRLMLDRFMATHHHQDSPKNEV